MTLPQVAAALASYLGPPGGSGPAANGRAAVRPGDHGGGPVRCGNGCQTGKLLHVVAACRTGKRLIYKTVVKANSIKGFQPSWQRVTALQANTNVACSRGSG